MRTFYRALSISFVMLAVLAGKSGAQEIHKEGRNLYSTNELKTEVGMSKVNQLQIKSTSQLAGLINISTATDSQVSVTYELKARTSSRSRAIDYIDRMAVKLKQSHNGATLALTAPNPVPWDIEKEAGIIELKILVPEFCSAEIDAPLFDLEALGPFGGMVNTSSMGRLRVSDVFGGVELVTSNQRVLVERITGPVSVATSNADIEAFDLVCLDGQAHFRNEAGNISIEDFEGGLNVKNSYGRIEILGFSLTGQKNYIRGFSGPISISITEMGDSYLIVQNRYEDIELIIDGEVSATMSLAVEEDGKIIAKDFPFITDLVRTNRLSLIAGDGRARINSSIRGNGNIYVVGNE